MYYALYIDVLFLENLLMDYLLLTAVGKLMKLSSGRFRRIFGSVLGSAGLCLIYGFSLQQTLPGFLLLHVLLCTAMTAAGLPVRTPRSLAKALILLYLCSFLMGGIFGWLQSSLGFRVCPFLAFSLTAWWILRAAMKWFLGFLKKERSFCTVILGFHGRTVQLRGLVDTGNHLKDPVLGCPVSVLHKELQQRLCGQEEPLFYPVPFHSLGKSHGILPAFFADFLKITSENGSSLLIERPLIGVTKEPLSSQKEYDILLHPELLSRHAHGERAPKALRQEDQFSGGNKNNAD